MENILRTSDQAIYLPPFENAIVTVPPGILAGSAMNINTVALTTCVEGDEKKVMSPGSYIAPPFIIPGMGIAKIKKLNADQLSTMTKAQGKKVMLKGTLFEAEFQVTVPAQQPTPGGPVPDPKPMYNGKGQFVTTNMTVQDYK